MVYCVIWCHSRWRGRKNLKVELRALLCPAPGPAKIICWHTTTTSENAWWRPERYEASSSSRCDTVNLILQWPTQFQKLFVSLLHPLPGAESIVTRVWQCTTYQAKDWCWVQWCISESHCGHFHQSSVHLQTDQFVIFPHLTARWLPSSLKQNRVWVSEDLQLATEKKHFLGAHEKNKAEYKLPKGRQNVGHFFLHFSWCICSLTVLHTVPKMHRQ